MKPEHIFVVDDDITTRRLLEHSIAKLWGYRTSAFSNGEECIENLGEQPSLIILDIMMEGMTGLETLERIKAYDPHLPVIMLSAQEKIDVAVETMKLGAKDYFTKPVNLKRLEFAIRNALETYQLAGRVQQLQETLERTFHFDNIVTNSGAMQNVLKLVDKACNSDISVLIEGESGTGKELIARAIHFNGRRSQRPFVVVNCAAIPRELLESEFFGHERGAFTGAVTRKIGKFEQAHTGTIFLDEIGEMEVSLQAKLLRVIQQKQFERVGGNEVIETDVRIISATNRDLRQASEDNLFREDLYYRVATFPIKLPPLRERPSEIPLLAEHFLRLSELAEGREGMSIAPDALQAMMAYPWPGNIRELRSVIERAVLIADSTVITVSDLPMTLLSLRREPRHDAGPVLRFASRFDVVPLERLKAEAVRLTLHLTDGNIAESAKLLDIGRTTLYDLMKRHGLTA